MPSLSDKIFIYGYENDLQIIEERKLLGIIRLADLKWAGNTDYIGKKACEKIGTLRGMKIIAYIMFKELALHVSFTTKGSTKRSLIKIN